MHESAKKKQKENLLYCQEDELGTAVQNNTAGLILGCVTYEARSSVTVLWMFQKICKFVTSIFYIYFSPPKSQKRDQKSPVHTPLNLNSALLEIFADLITTQTRLLQRFKRAIFH